MTQEIAVPFEPIDSIASDDIRWTAFDIMLCLINGVKITVQLEQLQWTVMSLLFIGLIKINAQSSIFLYNLLYNFKQKWTFYMTLANFYTLKHYAKSIQIIMLDYDHEYLNSLYNVHIYT